MKGPKETMGINLFITGCHYKLLQTITTWNTQIPFTQHTIKSTTLTHEDTRREGRKERKRRDISTTTLREVPRFYK